MAVDVNQEVDLVVRKINQITHEGQSIDPDNLQKVVDALMRNADLPTDPTPKENNRLKALLTCSEEIERNA
jgi:hypothetical protein